MIVDLKEYTDFLIKHKITPVQFFLCYILYLDGETEPSGKRYYPQKGAAIANVYKVAHHSSKLKVDHPGWFGWELDDVRYLQDVGFISNDSVVKKGLMPDTLYITPKFVAEIFALESDFDEFWETYPAFVNNFDDIRGPKIPLRAVDKEEVERVYKKTIPTRAKHTKLMEGLQYGVDNKMINMGILKFLSSEHWSSLLALKYEEKQEELKGGRFTIIDE